MTDAEVLAAIVANHLKANLPKYDGQHGSTIHWDRAWLDPGGTIFGEGPYAKVPISYSGPPVVGMMRLRRLRLSRISTGLRRATSTPTLRSHVR